MNKLFQITILLVFIFSNKLKSQGNDIFTAQTKMIIQSKDAVGKAFIAYSESPYMNLSLSTGDIYLDSVIKTKPQQTFIFKGKMSDSGYFFGQRLNDEKEYNLEGNLTLNNMTIPCVAQFDPVNFSEKVILKNTEWILN